MTEIDTSPEAVELMCRDLMDEPTLCYQEAERMLRALADKVAELEERRAEVTRLWGTVVERAEMERKG